MEGGVALVETVTDRMEGGVALVGGGLDWGVLGPSTCCWDPVSKTT